MASYIARRLLLGAIVIVLVSIIVFCLVQILPGDPALYILGTNAPKEQLDFFRHEWGLDRPLPIQYMSWLGKAFQGDFGMSITLHQPVGDLILYRLPKTLHLSLLAFVISTILGTAAGTVCAVKRGSIVDTVVTFFSNIGISLPVFWLGMLGIYFFGLKLGWVPTQGYTSPLENFWLSAKQVTMPVICLAIPAIAAIARQTRSSTLEVVRQDYVRTARSKGLRETVIVFRHVLKNAFIPVITLLGIQVGFLVGGQVLIENVFNIPGMGRLMTDGALNKDYPIVLACTMLIAATVVLVNILIDFIYGWLDPRIRYD